MKERGAFSMKKRVGRPLGSSSKNKAYSPEFKIDLIETFLKEKLGYREAARLLLPNLLESTARSNILRWERTYLEEGKEGFYCERRGRGRGNTSAKGRPRKLDKHIEEDLIAEVQSLRMENEYLKKLRALVLKRESEDRKRSK